MGNTGSSNKTNQVITNNTINKTTLDLLNQNIMNASVNTLINDAKTCSNSTNVNTNCSLTNSKSAGDIVIGSNQNNKVEVNFACVQSSQAAVDMNNAMMQELTTQMKGLSTTDTDSLLKSITDSQQKAGSATLGNTQTSNKTNNQVTNNVTNDVNTTVKNIFEQNLSNNFTQDTVSNCIGKTDVTANTSADNVEAGGNIKMDCVQTNDVKTVTQCEQLSAAISKTTTETLNSLGLSVASEN